MKQVRVNVRSVANMAAVRKEVRNGRDVVIVPSATLPDGVIMNGIKYPADEITKSFGTLERKPAPFGHPTINGKFVSASDPEGINISNIGAWNENVTQKDGRVFIDKVIDIEVANRSENGKAVLNAIDAGEPVHTSTGLLCELDAPDAEDHKHIARNIYFDHDAILLNEEGAATPEQGVGMLVNAKGEEIEVINSVLDSIESDLDWAADLAVRALEKQEKLNLFERLKSAMMDVFASERANPANSEEDADMTDKIQFEELSAKVNGLADDVKTLVDGIPEAIANAVKPLTDAQAEIKTNQEAKDAAELSGYVDVIVKANIMDEETAKELTLNAARKLVETSKAGKAAPIANGAFGVAGKDEFDGYDMNDHFKAEV